MDNLHNKPEQKPNSVTYKEVTEAMNALYMGDSKQVQMAMTMESNKLYTTPPQRKPLTDGSLINEGTKKPEPVAFFKTADLKAAWEAGYSAGRIAPLENKSTKVGTIGHIGDGKTTLTAAITPLLTEYKIGQELKVTHLNHGGAVYNNKREIINANKQPHKTICIGRIVEIKQECENGAVVVKCEGSDKFLPRFHFYPQDNGPDQIVEVLEQPKKSEPVGEILLSCGDYKEVSWKKGKLPPVGAKLYTTPPQRKPLTVKEIAEFVGTHEYGSEQLKWFRLGEAAHGIKE